MHELPPGLMVIHGNQPEMLLDLLVGWVRRYPLPPLASETVLVQSNGIAQWLKFSLARPEEQGGCGVAAALQVQLPSQFLWQAYRAALGAQEVPEVSPLDKAPLTWRLLRLLPPLLGEPAFAGLRQFLAGDDQLRKHYQLAERVADLFDQYQVYRADWLADWSRGVDQLRNARGTAGPVPADQQWQPVLWRALLADAGEGAMALTRSGVHQRFLQAMAEAAERPAGLPQRVVVFGISAMPAQALQALAAMARHSQVLLCVHNPCRHHWSDIVADRDLLRLPYRRQARKPGLPADLSEELLHQHAHPLLAAWGKQGRDYIHLIDEYDDPQSYRERFGPVSGGRIDLFEGEGTQTLLAQLHDDILELRPLAETRALWPAVEPGRDASVRFHIAHSPQREVEILHDQLLARLDADPTLAPRDIIVMVPDVDSYAPHIAAVFGRIPPGDPRHIPFTVADQQRRGNEPLLRALEQLLQLPDSRATASDILDLIEVPALRARFGIAETELPLLQRWMEGAGVRWGLDARQRESLGLAEAGDVNSWEFGLSRMLLGYAVGQGPAFAGIAPYDEIGGLDAAVLGPLHALLQQLRAHGEALAAPATPRQWGERFQQLLADFFAPEAESDALLQAQLMQLLERWLQTAQDAGFDEPVPLAVAREAWLSGLDQSRLQQRFLAGAVSFCTLMPMRAIPFRMVCLLGMDDGAFPRTTQRLDFDLMAQDWRPGDRSRRDDDRYLLLEALLSAREQLYVSWVGRSVRDGTERAPSVLVGQLRDHLAAGWCLESGGDLLAALTTEHPLQPFSSRYFGAQDGDRLYTYAHEWREVHNGAGAIDAGELLPPMALQAPLPLRALGDFLAQPVDAFFRQRLKTVLRGDDAASLDAEAFALDGLEAWQLQAALTGPLRPWAESHAALPADAFRQALREPWQQAVQQLEREGRLPLRAFAQCAVDEVQAKVWRALAHDAAIAAAWPEALAEPVEFRWKDAASGLEVQDWITGLRGKGDGSGAVARWVAVDGALHAGGSKRWSALLRTWVEHLALQYALGPTPTLLSSESDALQFVPLERAEAAGHLSTLAAHWAEGMRRPLPIASKTALRWLETRDLAKAQACYEGGHQQAGEMERSAALLRVYPRFEAWWGADSEALAEALYAPLMAALRPLNAEEGA
ncbi:MAG: exodeoxyribonuclease V subunit gamma [Comamonas sp.]